MAMAVSCGGETDSDRVTSGPSLGGQAVQAAGGSPSGGVTGGTTSTGVPGGGVNGRAPAGGARAGGAAAGGARAGGAAAGGARSGGAPAGGARAGGAFAGGTESGGTLAGGGTTGGAASGGAEAGGAAAGGGTSGGATSAGAGGIMAIGGMPTAGAAGSNAGAGGVALPEFCTGGARVLYQEKVLYPGVTTYPTARERSCCMTDTVHLHTRAVLGNDFEVDVTEGGGYVGPGEYEVGPGVSSITGASLRLGTDLVLSGSAMTGTLRFSEATPSASLRLLGLCLEVADPASMFYGVRVHVPSTNLDWSARFDIYLLADSTLSASAALATDFGSLPLASTPLVGTSDIVFVEQSTGLIGLSREHGQGESVRSQVQGAGLNGLPFMVVADGARIYVGAFMPSISSVALPCPTVMIEQMSADGFVIGPPSSGADPRNDPRILGVLDRASRLLP